jgi:uncharacterized protein (DUF952 family)
MITFHLVARDVWDPQRDGVVYEPEAFDADGFVHCTDGEDAAIETANRYYQRDGREYVVLSIDTDRLMAPVRYEDPQQMFPHVYGPIETSAVTEVRSVERDADGRFLRILSATHGPPLDQ